MMSMLKFYGYKQCSTCRKAEKFLKDSGIHYEFIDITENPPPAEQLIAIINQANISLNKIFNISGSQYRELRIKERLPALCKREVIALLSSNGRLIKRPLITDGKRMTVGFNAEQFAAVWN